MENGLKLKEFQVQSVEPTAYYIPDFVTVDEEKNLLSKLYEVPKPKWTQLSNRRLQNWGGIPHKNGMIAEQIPDWLECYLQRVHSLDVMGSNKPNHVLVNEYKPQQGILPHLDGSLFYPTIVTISLASHIVLNFFEPDNDDSRLKLVFSFLLEPRSLLVLQDKLFEHYLHGIAEVGSDLIDDNLMNLSLCSDKYVKGLTVSRDTRVSLTIRHVPKTTAFKINIGKR
ncbi:alpha-ketoglutarate-dependent dioxygenase alkB homolog 6 [Leptidea sinapis]|uniref:alpha-ketoglutarate-dependent dioxygenase alkB homolog 6 n=1 Tax=Leptidea sinapis TaxID=189913 RepID=UPI0021C2C287|nr:alpha-ketoglutarate-dependent dioxygenase alkB homolog 6 [Leptidea sinapis]